MATRKAQYSYAENFVSRKTAVLSSFILDV